MKKNHELVDIDTVKLQHETEKAYGLSQGEVDPKTNKEILIWVPKSQVQNNGDGTFTMPEWLAIDKGLV
jgi:uncharacterized protein YpmB